MLELSKRVLARLSVGGRASGAAYYRAPGLLDVESAGSDHDRMALVPAYRRERC